MRGRRLVALLFSLVLLASACGGDGGGDSASDATTTTASGGGSATTAARRSEPVKLGAIFDLSGPTSQVGTANQEVVQNYLKKVNDGGGINGSQVELKVEDGKSDQTAAVQAARRLVEQEKVVAIIGPNSSSSALAVKDYVNGRKVPMIASAGAGQITTPILPYIFKMPEDDVVTAQVQLAFMKKQGLERVAWLGTTSGFGQSGLKAYETEAPKNGIQLVAKETYNETDKDMSAQLTRIRGLNPQAVLIYGIPPATAIAQKNAKDLGLTMPIHQGFGSASAALPQQAGAAADNVTIVAGKLLVADQIPADDPQTNSLKELQSMSSRPTRFAADAYDAISLVTMALKSGATDAEAIRNYLENDVKDFPGADGVRTMTATDHAGIGPESLVIAQYQGGAWKLLDTGKALVPGS